MKRDERKRLNDIKRLAYAIDHEISREALIIAVLSFPELREYAAEKLNVPDGYLKDPVHDINDWKNSLDNKWDNKKPGYGKCRRLPDWPDWLTEEDFSLDFNLDDDEEDEDEDGLADDSELNCGDDLDTEECDMSCAFKESARIQSEKEDKEISEMLREMNDSKDREISAIENDFNEARQGLLLYPERFAGKDDIDNNFAEKADNSDFLSMNSRAGNAGEADNIESTSSLLDTMINRTEKADWIRNHVAIDVKSLRRRLEDSAQKTAGLFPQHASEIEKLKDMVFIQVSQLFEVSDSRPFPVFIFSNAESDVPGIIDSFSREMGCVLLKYDSGVEDETFREALKKFLAHILLISNCMGKTTSYSRGAYYDRVFDYFTYGRYYRNNIANYEPALLEECLTKKIVLLHIEVPNTIYKYERYKPSELVFKIMDSLSSGEDSSEEQHAAMILYRKISSLISPHNSVVFKPLSVKVIYNNILKDLNLINNELIINGIYGSRINIANSRLLAAIILLSNIDANQNNIRHYIKNILFSIYRKLEKNGCSEYTIRYGEYRIIEDIVENINNEEVLYDLLEQHIKILKINRSYLQSEFTIDCKTGEIIIKNIMAKRKNSRIASKYSIETPDTTFDDVIGFDEAKEKMRAFIDYLKNPEIYEKFCIKPENRLLLCGAPGTGKTFLARAFAGESKLPFFYISASEITSQKWAGWGAILLRSLFNEAKNYRPCILFIDELDALINRENLDGGSVSYDATSILNTFLVLLDGINTDYEIMVIGATNKPESLDEALTRAKRFGTRINASYLKYEDRRKLIAKKLEKELCQDFEAISEAIAVRTAGNISPAFIENIIEEAKRQAIIKNRDMLYLDDISLVIDNLLIGRKTREMSPEYKRSTAIHESGHALAVKLMSPRTRISKISIGHRDTYVGTTVISSEKSDNIADEYTRDDLIAEIMYSLAGSVAEKIEYGHWGTGSNEDIANASILAKYAVIGTDIGNGYNCSVEYFINPEESHVPKELLKLSKKLIEACSRKTETLLRQYHDKMQELTDKLYNKEDLEKDEVDAILGDISTDRKTIIKDIIDSLMGVKEAA